MARRTTDWEASAYHRLAAPQEEWAREVLKRTDLNGDETVLDAGCGSGRVTQLLLERLPNGRVIGVDGSQSMVKEAQANLSQWSDRLELIAGDLLELELDEPVDVVFSNATFHWIADHDLLFRRLRASLEPGGALVAQCGGEGNVTGYCEAIERAALRPEFAPAFVHWPTPWNFAGPERTEERLGAASFDQIRCWLEEKVVEPENPRDFVAVVGLAAHHGRLEPGQRDAFTDAVIEEFEKPLVLRYVRLNIDARAA